VSNLTQRVLTAIVGASIVISAILYSEYTLLLLMLFISIMSLLEFYRLYEGNGVQPQKFFGILIAISIFISPLLNSLMQIPVNLVAFRKTIHQYRRNIAWCNLPCSAVIYFLSLFVPGNGAGCLSSKKYSWFLFYFMVERHRSLLCGAIFWKEKIV